VNQFYFKVNIQFNIKLYQFIRSNGGWNQFTMIEIEKLNCSDGNEARSRERYWYELLNAQLNMVCPNRSKKEYDKIYYEQNKDKKTEQKQIYRQQNKDKIKEQKTEYYQQNKEKLKEKESQPILCECGCTIQKRQKSEHQKTIKHIKLMEQLNNSNDD